MIIDDNADIGSHDMLLFSKARAIEVPVSFSERSG
jgi:hypothetical protein